MRFRWFSVRYTEVARDAGPQALGDPWRTLLPITLAGPRWRPPADLFETPEALIVKVEIAGLSEEEFEITLYEDTLVVEGVRSWKLPAEAAQFHTVEVRYGPFRLELPIPAPVDRKRVRARYDLGFLKVTLPKMEVEMP
ncbi:MAG TPA: Hsp20/alpha crystallin family protein [Candidatus Manganitrophaceae bacterium]|nr:Hsp20/alpha crystallin family protein [Candidatus Manganitrophaceae bacterium]